MHESVYRRWLIVILLISVSFRLGFLFFGDVLPVMWDAGRYASGAIGLISYVDRSESDPVTSEKEDHRRFEHYNNKYIQGEQIDWLAYNPHTLSQASDQIFFSGPLYPAILGVIFMVSPAADFTVARVFGIIFDVLANLLLVLVGIRLVGRAAALLAGALYAVYFPFIMTSTMLLLETSTNFWLLLAIYVLMRGFEQKGKSHYVLAGIIAGLLILNKPTATFVAIPVVIGFYYFVRGEMSLSIFVNRLLYFSVPAVLLFLGWLVVASARYDRLALREPTYVEAMTRQSSRLAFEGYDLDNVDSDFWTYSVRDEILGHPVDFVELAAKKFERLWSRPYNDFKRGFMFSYEAVERFHKILVSLGLVGLLLLVTLNFRNGALPFFVAGYYTIIHIALHSISRYSFNALPMIMLTAGYLMVSVYGYYRTARSPQRRQLLSAAILLGLAWFIDFEWFSAISAVGRPYWLVAVTFSVKYGLGAVGLVILSRLLTFPLTGIRRFLIPVIGTMAFVVVGWSSTLARDQWTEFPCRLADPTVKAGTRIYMSNPPPVGPGDVVAAVLDLNSGPGRKNSFSVTAGNSVQEFVQGQPPLKELFYPKPAYIHHARFESIGIEQYRQYAIATLNPDSVLNEISQKGYFDIEVAINSRFSEPANYMNLYGNFPSGESTNYIPAVRFTAVERYIHRDDPRVRLSVKFLSDSTISYYIGRDGRNIRQSKDLSPAAGLQTGRYNIFLMVFKPDGSALIY